MELDTHLEIALRVEYVRGDDVTTIKELVDHVGRMLTRLLVRPQS